MIRKSSAGDASGLEWFKSSFSDSSDGNDCVEVAAAPGTVLVRDSKNLQGPRLAIASGAWAGFVSYAAGH
ncbi:MULTISPECIES: DUF397 domain-containing protein [unclassified Streptomyces]|uniref:DUF397 domain-containing protein n=1 Tax=unclassified Streptomyces TaxID=2593676 RepID=UPI002E151810|nr:DUF397 domain-containing protein [Streptomyces sp. NBC_01240]WSU23830.1 DUF397 domain-containing protein [Streptomyces sp. NBC_01108]